MSNGWSLAGNAVAAGDFLGTTNAQPLSVRTSGAERLRVQPDGRVGVGLGDPRTQLHVLAGISTGLDFSSAGSITFFPPDGFAWFHIDNGPGGGRPIGRLRISHGPTPGSQELMTLVQNGNVGIATSNPAVKLHVTGNRIRVESAGKRLDMRADGGAVDVQSTTHNLFLHSSGPSGNNRVIINPFGGEGNVGIGTQTPADKLHVVGNVRANDVVLTSDVRLKRAIRPIRGARRTLEKLRGVEFEWTESDGSALGAGAGFIAQEVESVAPELVRTQPGDGYKAVNVGGLLGTFVEAFKELAAENVALRRRIEALERAAVRAPAAGGVAADMDSLRSIASCIGVTGTFSVARDFLGFIRGAPSDVSVLTQVRRLQGRHVHMNFIRVGSDQFTDSDFSEMDAALQFTRDNYAQVSLGVGRIEHFVISTADADGADNINNDDEAEELTNDWTVPNSALDIFWVLTYSGSTIGLSRVDGPCDKDAKGMDGSVVAIEGTAEHRPASCSPTKPRTTSGWSTARTPPTSCSRRFPTPGS